MGLDHVTAAVPSSELHLVSIAVERGRMGRKGTSGVLFLFKAATN